MNPTGVVAAAAAFLSIWFGHVSVRRIEATSPTLWLPTLGFIAAGICLGWLSASAANSLASAILGIVGITLLWDALELWRQQSRVARGHAPANAANPRHQRMLAESESHATTVDLLKRNPVDYAVSQGEARRPVSE